MSLQIDCVSLIVRSTFTVFALFYFVFVGNFPSTSPQGGLHLEGRLNGGFFCHRFGGLIFGGTYTWRGLFSEFYGSVLIEQGILVLPHSRSPTVDVRISFANRTTGGLREQFFLVRYLVGRVFCNLAVFLDSGWQSIQVSNPPPLAQQFGTLPTQPTIHKTPHR